VDVWVTSTLAAATVDPLLKHFSPKTIFVIRRFIQNRLTPLDIEAGLDLTHLKRVRKTATNNDDGVNVLDVILCSASAVPGEEERREVVKEALEQGIELNPRLERVSRWPAYTPSQLSEFKSLWPTSLRIDSSRYT